MRFNKSIVTLAIFAIFVAALFGMKNHYDSLVYQGYKPYQQTRYTVKSIVEEDAYTHETFTFEGMDGKQVPVSAALPKDLSGPTPAIIMLYGIGQDMSFLKHIAAEIVPKALPFI